MGTSTLPHGIRQARGGALCRFQLAAPVTTFVRLLHTTQGALVGLLLGQRAGEADLRIAR